MLDDEDYEIISKMKGWYVHPEYRNNAKTNYAWHDSYGFLHRYILHLTDSTILVDHIDRNGLNCQKSNLRLVNCSENKRNSDVRKGNKFNFNGLTFEAPTGNRTWRIKVHYSTNEREINRKAYKTASKSFGSTNYKNLNDATKDAVLFRLEMMRKYGYVIDKRSETIEKEILANKENVDMEKLLNISFKDFRVE